MAVTAPVPPARPTPPVPPGQQGNSGNDGTSSFQPPDPGFVEAVKQAEAIGGALMKPAQKNAATVQPDQKTATPPASQGNAKTAANADAATKPPAAAVFSGQTAVSDEAAASGSEKAQTLQPAPQGEAAHKPAAGIPYWPFVIVVLAVGVTLLLMKIFSADKPKKKKRPVPSTVLPPTLPPGPEKVLRDKKPEEKKSRFEVRI